MCLSLCLLIHFATVSGSEVMKWDCQKSRWHFPNTNWYFRSSLVTCRLCIVTTSMQYLKRILRKYAGWVVWILVISFKVYCSASCLFLNGKILGFSLSPSEILILLAETMCAVQGISWIGNSWLIAEERNCIFGMLRSFTMFTRAQFWASCPSFWKSDAQIYDDRQP